MERTFVGYQFTISMRKKPRYREASDIQAATRQMAARPSADLGYVMACGSRRVSPTR